MQVYADPITVNCRKVLAALRHMRIPHAHIPVDYFEGAHKGEMLTALNPNQRLPALKDGDFVLWESNAILAYAADKHGRTDMYPADLRLRADIQRWLLWEASAWFPSCYVYLVENCVKPVLGSTPDPALLDQAAPTFHKLAAILDDRLSGRDYLLGDEPTIADFAVAAPMHLHGWMRLPLENYGALRAWLTERMESLPAWRSTEVLPGFQLPSRILSTTL